jgi:non-homologous end joining protein Ku
MYIGGVPKKKKIVAKKQHWEPGEVEDLFQEAHDELVASGEIEA